MHGGEGSRPGKDHSHHAFRPRATRHSERNVSQNPNYKIGIGLAARRISPTRKAPHPSRQRPFDPLASLPPEDLRSMSEGRRAVKEG